MLDTSRIFSENPEEKAKPVYVAIETKRFYGRDPSDLIRNLPAIINATQPEGFARYDSSKPYRGNTASFAAQKIANRVSSQENTYRFRERLRRGESQLQNIGNRDQRIERRRQLAREERQAFLSGARKGLTQMSRPAQYMGKLGSSAYSAAASRLRRNNTRKVKPNNNTRNNNTRNNNTRNNTRKNPGFFSSLFGSKSNITKKTYRPGSAAAAAATNSKAEPVATPPPTVAVPPVNTSAYKNALAKPIPTLNAAAPSA